MPGPSMPSGKLFSKGYAMNRRLTDDDFEFTEVDEIPRIERKIRKKRSTPTTRCVERFLESGARTVRIELADRKMTEAMRKRLVMYMRNHGLRDKVGVSLRKTDIYLYRKEEDGAS